MYENKQSFVLWFYKIRYFYRQKQNKTKKKRLFAKIYSLSQLRKNEQTMLQMSTIQLENKQYEIKYFCRKEKQMRNTKEWRERETEKNLLEKRKN